MKCGIRSGPVAQQPYKHTCAFKNLIPGDKLVRFPMLLLLSPPAVRGSTATLLLSNILLRGVVPGAATCFPPAGLQKPVETRLHGQVCLELPPGLGC